jgi:DNA replication protein DnaC
MISILLNKCWQAAERSNKMGYSKEVYRQALEVVAERHRDADRRAAQRKEELMRDIPELADIERIISRAGIEAAKAATALNGTDKIKEMQAIYEKMNARRKVLLTSAGLDVSAMQPHYSCTICNDTGYSGGVLCGCVRKIAKELVYSELCGKMPLKESTFNSFDLSYYPTASKDGIIPKNVMTDIFERCRVYADNFTKSSPNLLFLGATGLGKTHLSLAIAGAVIEKGYGVIYGSAQNFLNSVERQYFGKDPDGNTLEALLECDLLIMDDLGAEFTSAFVISTLYNIINTRIQCGLPTIISTNLSLSELESRYSQRIVSRFLGNYEKYRFAGNDIRQRKALEKLKK